MPPVIDKTTTKDADEIDFGRLVGEFIDHRKLIISVTSLFTLVALIYAIFSTPIYQADALIQVEQKQANAILSNLSQMLPDSQPQSAPEIALIQSRMILGKTVDDLNLQARIKQKYFPFFGRGLSRLFGDEPGVISVSHLYIPSHGKDEPEILLTVRDNNKYSISADNLEFEGQVGESIENGGISIKVNKLDAKPGTSFIIGYVSRLKAITDLQEKLSVTDQGKDTGMLTLSLNGDNPQLIEGILNS
ncbi:TPA: tyrosine-protein kinase, partial [Klebsiella pneumoniae]|nr:tyrosine-protein kinase [Klebsiella pneumoniae]